MDGKLGCKLRGESKNEQMIRHFIENTNMKLLAQRNQCDWYIVIMILLTFGIIMNQIAYTPFFPPPPIFLERSRSNT